MEYKALVSSARKTFNTGRTKDVKFRVKQLKGLVQMYKENEALFLEALKKDLRKPKQESIVSETDFCINDALGMIYEVEEWSKPVKVKRPPVNMMDGCMIKPEPLGVALVIGAWNLGPSTGRGRDSLSRLSRSAGLSWMLVSGVPGISPQSGLDTLVAASVIL